MYAIPWLLISSLSYALCSFVTSGSYFKLHYGKDTSEESLKPEHFQCDRDNSCTHLAKVKGGKILTVNGKKELEKINDVVCIWEKVSLPKETSTAPAVSGNMNIIYGLHGITTYCDILCPIIHILVRPVPLAGFKYPPKE